MGQEIDFPVTEKYGKKEILKMRAILFKMAKLVDGIFEKHNIKYCICFGTLLGAVRHQGFIPWDDDFDVFVFDDEYDRAMEILRTELPNWLVVHDEKVDKIYWPAWSRIRDVNSITRAELYPDDNHYKYKGINLDLYRLKKVPRNKVDLNIWKEHLKFYQRKHSVGLVPDNVFIEKTAQLESLISDEETKCTNDDGEYVFSFLQYMKAIDVDDFLPLRKYKFEDYEFWGPNNADVILKEMYGDYMSIPPYEKRLPHYSSVEYIDEKFDYGI